jgi:hypothetical protein
MRANIMKIFVYSIFLTAIFLFVSFAPAGKQRKITLPLGNHVGHIQWIKVTPYQAIKDSSGSIVKDTPIQNKIESWTYDEYGDELVDYKYGVNGRYFDRMTHAYYPNGDVKEIRDSSERIGTRQINDGKRHPGGHNPQVTYTFTYKSDTRYTNRYDASENLLSSAQWFIDNATYSAPQSFLNKYTYDSSGNMLSDYAFNNDTVHPCAPTFYQYNGNGQMTEKDEGIGQKTVFNRDMNGRVIDEATYFGDNGLIKDIKTTYDNSGDTFRVETRSPGGYRSIVQKTIVTHFIKQTNTLQEGEYDRLGRLTDSTVSHFDSENHLSDKKQFHVNYTSPTPGATGSIVMMEHLINDSHLNVIEDDKFSWDGAVEWKNTYQYKYDKVGNWVEQVWLTNDKPVQITEREIKYFKK